MMIEREYEDNKFSNFLDLGPFLEFTLNNDEYEEKKWRLMNMMTVKMIEKN